MDIKLTPMDTQRHNSEGIIQRLSVFWLYFLLYSLVVTVVVIWFSCDAFGELVLFEL